MRLAHGVALIFADMVVRAAEVDHDRASRLLFGELAHSTWVITDTGVRLHTQILAARGRDPCGESAVAESEHAGSLARPLYVMEGRGDVQQRYVGIELRVEVLEGALQVLGPVAEL